MVSWENQSQEISQKDHIEWMLIRRPVTRLVLMGYAPGGRLSVKKTMGLCEGFSEGHSQKKGKAGQTLTELFAED